MSGDHGFSRRTIPMTEEERAAYPELPVFLRRAGTIAGADLGEAERRLALRGLQGDGGGPPLDCAEVKRRITRRRV